VHHEKNVDHLLVSRWQSSIFLWIWKTYFIEVDHLKFGRHNLLKQAGHERLEWGKEMVKSIWVMCWTSGRCGWDEYVSVMGLVERIDVF
jgi:hypothetical protein